MRETPNLKLRMFDDDDVFHLADLNYNLSTLNTTQEQKAASVDNTTARVAYLIGNQTEMTYDTITWTIHKTANKKVIMYASYTLDGADFRLIGTTAQYSSFDYWNSLYIYFPDVIKSSNQIERLSVIAMSDDDRVWITGNRLENGSNSSDISIHMQSCHQHNTGLGESGISVTINIYAEGHLENYDGTFGLPTLSPIDSIDYSTFNSAFNMFTDDSPIVERRSGGTYVKMGTLEYLSTTPLTSTISSVDMATDVYTGWRYRMTLNGDEDMEKWLFIGVECSNTEVVNGAFISLGNMDYTNRKIDVCVMHYRDKTTLWSNALHPQYFLFVRKVW